MSEILHIKNFGPIKDVRLDLKKVNIFIGDQGTGKSTVAKLFSVLKNYASMIIFNRENKQLEENETWQFEQYLNLFEIKNYLLDNSEIYYKDGNRNIDFSYKEKTVTINFKREPLLPPSFNYIVAERVFISILSDALYGLNQFGTKLPTLFNRFGNRFSTARKEKTIREYKEILYVDFSHINGVDSIILQSGVTIPLSEGSTGLQGTIPLLVVFDNIVESIHSRQNSKSDHLLVIEEPELNLFPATQKKLLDYIVANNFEIESRDNEKKYNKKYKNQLLITTHSPYILTVLNNLMYSWEIGQKHKRDANKLIGDKYWLNADDVSVYQLLTNGTCENIMDEELKQIKVEKIDEISEVLSKQWHQLANLNFDKLG